jgi:Glyoxalase-like domain
MLKLDHVTVIAPSLAEGVLHVRNCLDLDVPFGQRHAYTGTYNHLLQLGDTVYLEIVALDPDADAPGRRRWFGLDDQRDEDDQEMLSFRRGACMPHPCAAQNAPTRRETVAPDTKTSALDSSSLRAASCARARKAASSSVNSLPS